MDGTRTIFYSTGYTFVSFQGIRYLGLWCGPLCAFLVMLCYEKLTG